uniref:Cytochrome c oxidase subunit 7A2 n=1 Tax=Propithecus coquereli TaxID=379532 RepID=A0A2K6FY65_PROCO
MLRNLLGLRQIAQRTISTASRRHFENKVPEKQKLFQEQHMPYISWLWLHFPRSRIDFSHPSSHLVQFHSPLRGPVI